ncbi:MAG: hypothetical protein SNG27_03375 [Rikenellaceae bacterium]
MKRIFATLSLFAILTSLTSCDLKHDDDINLDQIWMSDLYGKWDIWSTESIGYESIEFSTEGYYFIEESKSGATMDQEVLYGKYKKTGDYQVTAYDVGVLDITDYSDTKIWYDITLDGKTQSETHKATSAVDRDETISDNTDLIGTIWKVYSYSYEAYQEIFNIETDVAYLYISTAGTFISIDKSGNAYSYEWTWSNTDEDEIKVSNGNSYSNWTLEGISTFEVSDLSNNDMLFEFETDITVDTEDGTETLTNIPFTMRFERSSNITIE